MVTSGPIQGLELLVVLGLLTGIIGQSPIKEVRRPASGNHCMPVCPGAQSCIITNNGVRFLVRCVYPNGQERLIPYTEPELKNLVDIEPQSGRQESPDMPPAHSDSVGKPDVRSANASHIRHSILKALGALSGRSPNRNTVIPASKPMMFNFSRRPNPDTRPDFPSDLIPVIRVTFQPAVPITIPQTIQVPSGNPQCEYCESADQCKDEKRPYCYHSHACARRVCQSL